MTQVNVYSSDEPEALGRYGYGGASVPEALHVRRKGAHEVAWLSWGLLAVREHVKYATWSEAFIKLYKQTQTKSKMITEII